MGEETEKLLALRYPNSYYLFDELDHVCTIAKTQNRGKVHIEIDAHGLDLSGKLIVKKIRGLFDFWRKSDEASA